MDPKLKSGKDIRSKKLPKNEFNATCEKVSHLIAKTSILVFSNPRHPNFWILSSLKQFFTNGSQIESDKVYTINAGTLGKCSIKFPCG